MPASFSRSTNFVGRTTQFDVNPVTCVVQGSSVTFPIYTSMTETRSFAGTSTANFKAFRDQNGYLPTLACTDIYTKQTAQQFVRRIYVDRPCGRTISKEEVVADVISADAPPPFPSSLTDEVWSALRMKVLDQDFNAPVFLAEAHKSLDMILDRTNRFYRALRAFRRGRLGDVATYLGLTPGTIHNTWLEWRYGWRPLLQDIHGAAVSLAKLNFRRDQYTIRQTRSRTSPGTVKGSSAGTVQYTAKAWVTVRVHNSNVQVANKLGGLNPLSVAWELVPFSFVADWFVNIGDCIAEASAFAGVTVLTGGSSSCVSWVGTVTEANPLPYDLPRKTDFLYREYRRFPGVQTLPRLQIRSNPLNINRLITSAALIRQQIGGGFRYR